jgi:hypothetical protein
MTSHDQTKRILDAQYSEDQPVVIDQDGNIHPASDGHKGLAITDPGGDYAR